MTSDLEKQLPLCCPCGSGELYRRGLCEPCYNRGAAPTPAAAPAHMLMRETDGKANAASALVLVSPVPLVELVLDSLASPHSRRAYGRVLGIFFDWYPLNASGEGFTRVVLRRVDKSGRVGPGPITPQGVFEVVVSYVRRAGLGKITPHDLRRTFAKLAHLGRAPLEQIQISLGHASIQTTRGI